VRFEGERTLLRVFIGEADRFGSRPLHQALVERARAEGVAGATVLRGIEGFGASSRVHTTRILRLSEDLPVIVEVVDTEERIQGLIPIFEEMLSDGLMTLERAEVLLYRGRGGDDGPTATVVRDRLRILTEQVSALDGSVDGHVDELHASVRAAHEYGATEAEIAQATGWDPARVRAILAGGPEEVGGAEATS
jgi:PII-like signaling protein